MKSVLLIISSLLMVNCDPVPIFGLDKKISEFFNPEDAIVPAKENLSFVDHVAVANGETTTTLSPINETTTTTTSSEDPLKDPKKGHDQSRVEETKTDWPDFTSSIPVDQQHEELSKIVQGSDVFSISTTSTTTEKVMTPEEDAKNEPPLKDEAKEDSTPKVDVAGTGQNLATTTSYEDPLNNPKKGHDESQVDETNPDWIFPDSVPVDQQTDEFTRIVQDDYPSISTTSTTTEKVMTPEEEAKNEPPQKDEPKEEPTPKINVAGTGQNSAMTRGLTLFTVFLTLFAALVMRLH